MAFTYASSNVGSSGLSTVRFYCGETSSGTAVLNDDGAITGILDNITSNHYLAAALCCDALEAHYADQADTDNEGLSVKGSQRAKAYAQKASRLRRLAVTMGAPAMFVGGRSQQTKTDRAAETDLVQPSFTKDQFQFPGVVASSTEQ